MSILLSAYYPEGIVYVADKNITMTEKIPDGIKRYVEPVGVKVLSWPYRKAVVGFVGLASLAGLDFEEWLRIFIANNREFDDIRELAIRLRDEVQNDYSQDFCTSEVHDKQLIIHLGGFTKKDGIYVPVLFHIRNYSGTINPQTGKYPPGERIFGMHDAVEDKFKEWPNPEDYPLRTRERLQEMIKQNRYLWFNNGYSLGEFNVFKAALWEALRVIREHEDDIGSGPPSIKTRVAFCRMAVELFGSYFTYHNYPEDRIVGGGSDAVYIPWPEVG